MEKIDHRKPDIVLLDLYHPKDKSADFEDRVEIAEEQILNLEKQILITKEAVDKTRKPYGLDLLENIRSKYSARQLPVVIYTEHGMALLSDEELRRVEELDGHWMKKNYLSDITGKFRLERIMDYAGKSKSVMKTYGIALITTYCLIGLALTVLYVPIPDRLFSILAGIMSAFISGLLMYFVTEQIQK